jgi:hypothetical protein
MLQTCNVGCCVEEEKGSRLLMLDVARNTCRNMGHLGIVSGEEGPWCWMLHAMCCNMGRCTSIWRLMVKLLRIRRLRKSPMLTPGTDVRALAVPCPLPPYWLINSPTTSTLCVHDTIFNTLDTSWGGGLKLRLVSSQKEVYKWNILPLPGRLWQRFKCFYISLLCPKAPHWMFELLQPQASAPND